MVRSPSFLLFCAILLLSFALIAWWTWFLVQTSGELAAAGELLVTGKIDAAAQVLGAGDAAGLAELGRRRVTMFTSEGIAFTAILLVAGWLYLASERREAASLLAQDRFLAAATHELKTPLATITLLLESLRDDRLPASKRARYLANGLGEAERLERGLDNLLLAAGLRSTSATERSQLAAGDLVTDVRAAIAALAARAAAADIALTAALPMALPSERDPAAVQLVLRNLLDNAIKFSPAGSAVQVELAAQEDHAVLRVRDQGRGLDANELQCAFRPFWRGSDTASGGTGLGLHLVRELVRAHGGSVSADSAGRNRGAEFTVRLPLRRQAR